jgi:F-type H+-transporting ATPase subunit epsilon
MHGHDGLRAPAPVRIGSTPIRKICAVATMNVELVAPDRMIWSGEAEMVIARTTDGDIGILPGHAPLLGVMVAGEVRITGDDGEVIATVDGGFLSVDHDRVTVVAETASVGADTTR